MLSVRGLSKSLSGLALRDISFDVQAGRYFVLLGASGVGKSVLLETIAGMLKPDSGRILLDEKDITNEKIQERKVALVFQDSTLFPHMTVYDNIAYPLRSRKSTGPEIRRRVSELAEDFGVEGLLRRRPDTLSGGETQRVCLARALASKPKCLLLDEPISSLDAQSRPRIRALLRRINSQTKMHIVHVTHDYIEAASLGANIAVMEKGRIVQCGTTADVFQRPKSEFVASFVGIRNFFKGKLAPPHDDHNAKCFEVDGLAFSVLTAGNAGPGYLMVRSEDVTISNQTSLTSARNNFAGTITDITPAAEGIEVIVDIGLNKPINIAALVTAESVELLKLTRAKKVQVSFKASAVKFVEQ